VCIALQTHQAVLSIVKIFAILLFGRFTQCVCDFGLRVNWFFFIIKLASEILPVRFLCDHVTSFVVQQQDTSCFLA